MRQLLAVPLLALLCSTGAAYPAATQEGYTVAAPTVTTHSWTDIEGCRYKAHIDDVGHETVKVYIDIDSCGRSRKTWMHAWAVCASDQTRYGVNENVGGTWSKTGGCPNGNLFLHKWGLQSYQYVRASGREWVTHVFGMSG